MNDEVYKFKRYEDASLIYTGIDKHSGENIGLYSTVISRADYDAMAGQLAASMTAIDPRDDDIPERTVFMDISRNVQDDEEDLGNVSDPMSKYETKRKPIVAPSKPMSTPTFRPSYVPPAPSITPVTKKTPCKLTSRRFISEPSFCIKHSVPVRLRVLTEVLLSLPLPVWIKNSSFPERLNKAS